MLKTMLACCKLYISESRNVHALELIEHAAKAHPEVVLINKFKDEVYNRVGYTIVSPLSHSDASPLRTAVFDMVKAAFEAIDLELHYGSHPRLGVVDHICFHPLAQATLPQVAEIAKSVACDIGKKLQAPIYLYGACHEGGRTLDSIRRKFGYFKPNSAGNQWTGSLKTEILELRPDVGPLQPPPSKGIVVVGATRWVDNYNVPVWCTDIDSVRRIASKVRERGGGLKSVQAMALSHAAGCIEVACNLLDPSITGADQVQSKVQRLAAEEGFKVGEGYFTDFSGEKITEMYLRSISFSCGRG
ncbi:glutamate formimidoyltransferase-like [Zingiber officinale]|uniref:Formimidoyltransferase-cyclodeaminase-like n=1 Tax=Zingiber officinale TaxID=94328 RepID=A0A8J5LU59_ZINOF|nr:glutamate formimidoyltransferase-like [Zingiber officinale]XP_042426568.1 glutamate formimidoyltransferase-like [Zingiber officinale]KAG6535083.1 hypothetical protein ZIOFF_000037 [Zingiber officinale]